MRQEREGEPFYNVSTANERVPSLFNSTRSGSAILFVTVAYGGYATRAAIITSPRLPVRFSFLSRPAARVHRFSATVRLLCQESTRSSLFITDQSREIGYERHEKERKRERERERRGKTRFAKRGNLSCYLCFIVHAL